MTRYILSIIVLCATLAQAMEVNAPLLPDPQVLETLRNILKEEKIKPGTFIKKIIDNLKQCTNGKMIELSYLTVKSAYWWDKKPHRNSPFEVKYTDTKKDLLIDRKFRSSIYDREYGVEFTSNIFYKHGHRGLDDMENFVNSWSNMRDKVKFFRNEDIIVPNTIPDSLKNIMGYGFRRDDHLDTYPSVYQMIRAMKTLKYENKVPKCSVSSLEIVKEDPSDVILEGVNKILTNSTYNRFIQQNHPLSKIIQNHLQTLKGKAEQKHFTSNVTSNEYKKPILYHKILGSMNDLIQLMSVFDIDLAAGECQIPGFNSVGDPYYLYAQLYEVFNDLLFLLMSVDNPYSQEDFDKFLTNAYLNRFSIFKDLSKNQDIIMASYPMRSGMDAFLNASMAIGHAPQDISIASKVADLENTVYYEISKLLEAYPNRGEMKSVVFLPKKPDENTKTHIDDAILRTYIDIQVDKNLSSSYSKKIDFGEYVNKIMLIINNSINLSYQKRVIICENIISDLANKIIAIGNDRSQDDILKILNLNVADLLEILDKGSKQLKNIEENKDFASDPLELFMKNLAANLRSKYPFKIISMDEMKAARNLGVKDPYETLDNFYRNAFNFESDLLNKYQSYFFDDSDYTIKRSPEQIGTNEERVAQCIKIIKDIRNKYPKSDSEYNEEFIQNYFNLSLEQLSRLDGNEKQDISESLKMIMEKLRNNLSLLGSIDKLKPELNPLFIYNKQNLQGKSKEILFSEIKKLINNKDIFHLQETGGEYYIELPRFMANSQKLLPKLKDQFPNLIDNTFKVDKYHSITSGMTTDTIDPSGDLTFMDKLHRKINQIRLTKQAWNPIGDPFIILWDTTMEIDQGPCYGLMEKFRGEIESGQIVFVLFKSLQKYANLGVGKSKAGVVTLVGKKGPIVQEIHNKLTAYGKDVFSNSQEYALMTFFNDPFNQDNEKLYYQAVREHAQKIHETKGEEYKISGGCLFTVGSCDASIPYSDTFGFAIPTATALDVTSSLCRYSVGLNPKGLK